MIGLPDEDTVVDVGYFDVELEVWSLGEPDILSGEWMPQDALLAMGAECPTYERTEPEICFASEDAARLAGFRKSRAPQSAA
jgi:hypothetical protein